MSLRDFTCAERFCPATGVQNLKASGFNFRIITPHNHAPDFEYMILDKCKLALYHAITTPGAGTPSEVYEKVKSLK